MTINDVTTNDVTINDRAIEVSLLKCHDAEMS